jgi:malonyl-CoA decarboxylase
LSPIPGFRSWLSNEQISLEDRDLLNRIEDPAWHLGEVPERLKTLLMRLCAHYLLHGKQGDEPLDPVARFHLGNGASLDRINWLADSSEHGMQRSAGLMVNYVYWLAELEHNHEQYFKHHDVVASPGVERLAREWR